MLHLLKARHASAWGATPARVGENAIRQLAHCLSPGLPPRAWGELWVAAVIHLNHLMGLKPWFHWAFPGRVIHLNHGLPPRAWGRSRNQM